MARFRGRSNHGTLRLPDLAEARGRVFFGVISNQFWKDLRFGVKLETGIGGVKSPKIRGGGGENFEFPGPPEIAPFPQRF